MFKRRRHIIRKTTFRLNEIEVPIHTAEASTSHVKEDKEDENEDQSQMRLDERGEEKKDQQGKEEHGEPAVSPPEFCEPFKTVTR